MATAYLKACRYCGEEFTASRLGEVHGACMEHEQRCAQRTTARIVGVGNDGLPIIEKE